jgi:integrase
MLSGIVKKCAQRAGIERLTPHDLRGSSARLCHSAGGELEQIQFLQGHISVQTTERYVGCKQQLNKAVNDRSNWGQLDPQNFPRGWSVVFTSQGNQIVSSSGLDSLSA